ncbi:MAG: hypothetical protein GY886_08665, partial [Gammaproteobacteria bacterium]|nr:hypothetical protein [Gammaproteobacteria bacterium]
MLNTKEFHLILRLAYLTLALALFTSASAIANPSGTTSHQAAWGNFDTFTHLDGIGIVGLDSRRHVDGIPLLAVGQVTDIDSKNSTISVNGLNFIIDDVSTLYDSATSTVNPTNIISTGEYVSIAGEMIDPGVGLATLIQRIPTTYVPGSSYSYSRIIVENIDTTFGTITSGNATIDFQNALFNPNLSGLTKGDVAEFIGFTTGTIDNNLIALSGKEILSPLEINQLKGLRGQRGTGLRGQRGTGLRGQRGTGLRGQRGTGLRGQRGTGLRGQRGTGLRGQRGTGLRGQRGTGLRGQRGTGLRGQRGTGLRGQRGTGLRGQRGTGLRGQRGTGLRGQRGTGLRGQRGTGLRG